MTAIKNIIIFKSEDDNKGYMKCFEDKGIHCKIVPPIQFEFINGSGLKSYLTTPEYFSGIIFTSRRSVEAVESVYKCLQVAVHNQWRERKTFAIGYSTADKIRNDLGLTVVGGKAANSEQLCSEIVLSVQPFSKPLLYPCGNLKKDVLPIFLAKKDIDFKAVTCYNTMAHSKLETNLSTVLSGKKPECMVFFSPSGVSFTIPLLKKAKFDFIGTKIIAIGPTTNAALVKENVPVSGICSEPNCEAILKLIC